MRALMLYATMTSYVYDVVVLAGMDCQSLSLSLSLSLSSDRSVSRSTLMLKKVYSESMTNAVVHRTQHCTAM